MLKLEPEFWPRASQERRQRTGNTRCRPARKRREAGEVGAQHSLVSGQDGAGRAGCAQRAGRARGVRATWPWSPASCVRLSNSIPSPVTGPAAWNVPSKANSGPPWQEAWKKTVRLLTEWAWCNSELCVWTAREIIAGRATLPEAGLDDAHSTANKSGQSVAKAISQGLW